MPCLQNAKRESVLSSDMSPKELSSEEPRGSKASHTIKDEEVGDFVSENKIF